MGKKSLEPITESMFYVLLCLHSKNMYGTEMAELVRMFFASANSQKLQAKMEKFASPFWRKLQAVRHSSSTADMLLS